MCLELREAPLNRKPWNKGQKTKWKVVEIECQSEGVALIAPYRMTKYGKGVWMRAQNWAYGPAFFGFHVMTGEHGAKYHARPRQIVIKVKVKGFLRSGWYRGKRCETWRYMMIPKKEYERAVRKLSRQP